MTQELDKDHWEAHWQQAGRPGDGREVAPNPHLIREIRDLPPGTALDAGCGEGAEAIWLATQGWQVTAADISSEALARASHRASRDGAPLERLQWVEADLTAWEPDQHFDLVTTHYAHPAMPQLAFYDRIADWVVPGGTLLIVGHLRTGGSPGHGHRPPDAVSVTAATITARLDAARWTIVTADERLHDVVVRATRHP